MDITRRGVLQITTFRQTRVIISTVYGHILPNMSIAEEKRLYVVTCTLGILMRFDICLINKIKGQIEISNGVVELLTH